MLYEAPMVEGMMINIFAKEAEGVWLGVACDHEKVYATSFGSTEKRVLHGLLGSIPFNTEFQQSKTATTLAERVIGTLKDIYDGTEVSDSFPLAMNHLSTHTQKVLTVTASIPLGFVASYGSVAEAACSSPRGCWPRYGSKSVCASCPLP